MMLKIKETTEKTFVDFMVQLAPNVGSMIFRAEHSSGTWKIRLFFPVSMDDLENNRNKGKNAEARL